MTISITSASTERFFFKLKIIKGYKSTMMQECLSGLALISIKQKTGRKINFEDLIDKFTEAEAKIKTFDKTGRTLLYI